VQTKSQEVGKKLTKKAEEAKKLLGKVEDSTKKAVDKAKLKSEDVKKKIEKTKQQAQKIAKSLDPKKLTKKYEEKVLVPIQTTQGTINMKLNKLKEALQKSFVSGQTAVTLPAQTGTTQVSFQTVSDAVKKGEETLKNSVNTKIDKLLLTGDKAATKVDVMLDTMYKNLFNAQSKLQESKAVQKAQQDIALRQQALTQALQKTTATAGTTDSTASTSTLGSIWSFFFG